MLSKTSAEFRITDHIIGLSIFLSALIWIGEALVKIQRCDGFIQKPFDIKSLSQKIREILD
jgi:hypothetical protein